MSRFCPSLFGLAALAACLATPTQAFLISQSTQGTSLKHDVRIVDHVVRATIHEGWADVEEEMNLGPQASRTTGSSVPTTNLDSWEIAGDFTLPEGSVLTGALLWNGSTILKAKLKGAAQADAEYEDSVRRNPVVIRPVGDPLVIRKNGNNYSMKLFPVNWTGNRHMRVRYLVPLQADGDGWKIPLGSAFAQEVAGHANQYEMEISNEGGSALRLVRDGMKTPISHSTKLVDYPSGRSASFWTSPAPIYHAPYAAALPQKGSLALATRIDSGSWKGGYLIYKGRLPDTLLETSNLRQEVLVLWKWNNPRSFVQAGRNDEELSNFGTAAVNQAFRIKDFTLNLASSSTNIRVGLVSDEGDTSVPHTFPLSGAASDTFAQMQDYLGGITAQALLQRFDPAPNLVSGSANSAKDRKENALRFAADLKIAFSLYSQDSGIVRHILFVTVGAASDLADPSVDLPDWPANLTASQDPYWNGSEYGAHWTGVNLPALIRKHELSMDRSMGFSNYIVPRSRVTWSLEFQSGERRFSVDGIAETSKLGARPMVEFNGHAASAWETSLTWTLYGETGNVLRTAREPAANWIELPDDSAVARLWGGSTNHWSDTWKTRTVGDIFGFVDPSYSLLAVPSDSLGSRLQTQYQISGVPFLLGSEIIQAIDSGKEVASTPTTNPRDALSILGKSIAGFSVHARTGGHGLHIVLPAGLDASSLLVVRDLRGRILSQWSGTQLASLRTIDWNAGLVRGMIYVELRTSTARTVQTATIL